MNVRGLPLVELLLIVLGACIVTGLIVATLRGVGPTEWLPGAGS